MLIVTDKFFVLLPKFIHYNIFYPFMMIFIQIWMKLILYLLHWRHLGEKLIIIENTLPL